VGINLLDKRTGKEENFAFSGGVPVSSNTSTATRPCCTPRCSTAWAKKTA
jgi:hypothetical protein